MKSDVIVAAEKLLAENKEPLPNPEKLREVLEEIDTRPNLVPMPEVKLMDEKLVIMPDGSKMIGQVQEIHHFINGEGKAQTQVGFKILRPA
jgi:hypothetical protein